MAGNRFIFIVIAMSICVITIAGWRLWKQSPASVAVQSYTPNHPLKTLIGSSGTDSASLFIWINKKTLTLSVMGEDSLLIKSYPVVLGGNPVDDKRMQGDQCTPEGTFHVKSSYPHDKWTYFAWIDYPTEDSWQKHREAKANGLIPANAMIGGDIGIHGVPSGAEYMIDERMHWTLGCISLCNSDIRELYPYLKTGRKIVIVNH